MYAIRSYYVKFVGKWKSTDVLLTAGDQTFSGTYTFDCSAVNMNTGILAHEKFVSEEMGTMVAENLMGFDPNLKQMHLYTRITSYNVCYTKLLRARNLRRSSWS